jgi:hypothetical protein
MQARFWRSQFLGVLAGLAVLSLSAASLQAQDTTTAGAARLDTSATDSIKHDSTMRDSTLRDTTKKLDTLKQNPPGYRGMEQDTAGAAGDTSSATGDPSAARGDTSAAATRDQTSGSYNDSTWRDSAGLNREKGAAGTAGSDTAVSTPSQTVEVTPDTVPSDTSKMGP